MVQTSQSFVDDTLWPEYLDPQAALHSYFNEAAERIIREEVSQDAGEAKERGGITLEIGRDSATSLAPRTVNENLACTTKVFSCCAAARQLPHETESLIKIQVQCYATARRTNDPSGFSLGTATTWSRRFWTSGMARMTSSLKCGQTTAISTSPGIRLWKVGGVWSHFGRTPDNCFFPARFRYDAWLFAAVSWLFDVVQIPEMLPPAPRNRAADAKATNAMSSVYSIKS